MRHVFVIALLLGFSHSASADSRAKLFPLSSSKLPKSLKGAPAELSQVLSEKLGAELTTVPIEDAAELIECSLTQNACLEAIARSVGVSTIIFGRIEMRDDMTVVKLTQFEAGKGETQRVLPISGETVDAMTSSLRDTLDNAGKKRPVEPPTTTPLDTPSSPSEGGPTTGTWGMVVGGGVVAGVGLAFLASANTMRSQINRAPTATRDDIDHLIGLEKAAKTRMQVGGGMLAVGGVVATIGLIRMVYQKSSRSEKKPMVDVLPEKGGASVLLTMGWR